VGGIIRAVFGYWFLVLMVRVVGRRPGEQLTPFEFVLIFFIGGLTLTPMVGDDRSFTNALCTIMGIALGHYTIAFLRLKSPAFGRVVDGTPLVLFEKGQAHVQTMVNMGVQDDDVMALARDQGIKRLDQIEYAVLERNGGISIIPKEEES
jgi:uncharacterized membrane protein YcaP (DUF421 family)